MKPTTESSVIKVPGIQFLPAAFAVVPLKTGAQVCAGIAVGGSSLVIVCISVCFHEDSISRFLDRCRESSKGFSGISHICFGVFHCVWPVCGLFGPRLADSFVSARLFGKQERVTFGQQRKTVFSKSF